MTCPAATADLGQAYPVTGRPNGRKFYQRLGRDKIPPQSKTDGKCWPGSVRLLESAFMKYNQLTFALLGMLLCLVTGVQAADADFMAGAAKHDITPLEPVPMWGYGARHAALSEGILDPLLATAVVIQAGDQKLAIVGLDLGR